MRDYGLMKITIYTRAGKNKKSSQDCVLVNDRIFNDYQGELDTVLDNLCVADGVGGVSGGYEASRFVMEHFALTDDCTTKAELTAGLHKLNEELIAYSSGIEGKTAMATTFTGIVARKKKIFYMHAGNTRLYAFANGELEQLSTDHTNYQSLMEEGMSEAAQNTPKNIIHTCFGTGNKDYLKGLQVGEFIPTYSPEMIILTSDGIHDHVDNGLMEYILKRASGPSEAVRLLAEAAVRNGSEDDTTVVIASR